MFLFGGLFVIELGKGDGEGGGGGGGGGIFVTRA